MDNQNQRNREIIELYQDSDNSLTMAQIGEKFGISRQRVQQILRKNGVYGLRNRRRKRREETEKLDALIKEEYTGSNLTAEEIAQELGVKTYSVRKAFERLGEDRTYVTAARTASLYNDIYLYAKENPDVRYQDVAKTFDVSKNTVARALRRFGYRRHS